MLTLQLYHCYITLRTQTSAILTWSSFFSGGLCICIVDKAMIFHSKPMGDQQVRQAAGGSILTALTSVIVCTLLASGQASAICHCNR